MLEICFSNASELDLLRLFNPSRYSLRATFCWLSFSVRAELAKTIDSASDCKRSIFSTSIAHSMASSNTSIANPASSIASRLFPRFESVIAALFLFCSTIECARSICEFAFFTSPERCLIIPAQTTYCNLSSLVA